MHPRDVSAVVCTRNSIASIERCLVSLRGAGVGEIIVVDAHSRDGTLEIVSRLADHVVHDEGRGLGHARNMGIALTRCDLILNMGSDNIMPSGQLEVMIRDLEVGRFAGVSARTRVEGSAVVAQGLNAWREGRFRVGPASVIGTPTLFIGELLRRNPFESTRVFSDDSELCERWSRNLGARFAISEAQVLEVGKATWSEVRSRCMMYGYSDYEVFHRGTRDHWPLKRRLQSIGHPFMHDFLTPLRTLPWAVALKNAPFLGLLTVMRYWGWVSSTAKSARSQGDCCWSGKL